MLVIRELVERLVWRMTLNRRLGEVFVMSGGAALASRSPPSLLDGAWWGSHDPGNEASALFAALHRDDLHEAAFRAHRLQRAGRLRGMSRVCAAAESLEVALISSEACGAVPVFNASIELVRSLTDEGVLVASNP